jgi:hypothetical protein
MIDKEKSLIDTQLIGAEGAKTPVGVWGWGDPAGAKRRGGSPSHPRTARFLSGNQQQV